jgi:hypothetical protein
VLEGMLKSQGSLEKSQTACRARVAPIPRARSQIPALAGCTRLRFLATVRQLPTSLFRLLSGFDSVLLTVKPPNYVLLVKRIN